MKPILILILLFPWTISFGQEIQIIEQNEIDTKELNIDKFECIDNSLDLTNHKKILALKGYTLNFGKNTLVNLFNSFWKTSNNFGANAYVIDKVEAISDTIYVQISSYYFDEKMLDENFKLYPKNKIYVFGDLDTKKGKIKKIKLNKEKVELAPLEYISYQNEVGEYATVSIGGLLGAKVDLKGRENRLPIFLSLNGFGVGPGSFNQISISFNTGRIYPVNMNFGSFLINIITEKKL